MASPGEDEMKLSGRGEQGKMKIRGGIEFDA
jgi:hypothetical protein